MQRSTPRRWLPVRPIMVMLMALIGAGVIALSCGGNDADPQAASHEGVQGEAGLCANVTLLGESLAGIQSFTATTSLREAQMARQKVELSLTELQEAEAQVPMNITAKLQSSFTDFDATLDSLSAGESPSFMLSDEVVGLKARAVGLFEAQEELQAYARCPEQGGGP